MAELLPFADAPPGWVPASAGRRLLALVIDYLLFGALWTLGLWGLRRPLPGFHHDPVLVKALAFAAVEAALIGLARWTPGLWLLGIHLPEARALLAGADEPPGAKLPLVREELARDEAWWTILFGVLALVSGMQSLVRWTFGVPTPWFGLRLPAAAAGTIDLTVGVLEGSIGIAALKLRRAVLPLAVLVYGTAITSAIIGWDALPGWIGTYAVARWTLQGLPVDPREVQHMQRLMPPGFLVLPAIALAWAVPVFLRARRHLCLSAGRHVSSPDLS
jgi:hypothetical protein